jgi:hypothetical protein
MYSCYESSGNGGIQLGSDVIKFIHITAILEQTSVTEIQLLCLRVVMFFFFVSRVNSLMVPLASGMDKDPTDPVALGGGGEEQIYRILKFGVGSFESACIPAN